MFSISQNEQGAQKVNYIDFKISKFWEIWRKQYTHIMNQHNSRKQHLWQIVSVLSIWTVKLSNFSHSLKFERAKIQ